jgi:hypothetical protein
MTTRRLRVLVVTGGHAFDRDAFGAMWNSLPDVDWAEAKHPGAQAILTPGASAEFDAIAFHDIPGIRFHKGAAPEMQAPSAALRAGFAGMIAAGKPMLFLHHAMAGWPAWDAYAQVIGARFLYQPGSYDGLPLPCSGYLPQARYTAMPALPHPVTKGLEDGLALVDELYHFQLLEPDILPLLVADHDFSGNSFFSAASALRGRPAAHAGAAGCPIVAWARRAGRAPVIVVQPGDNAATFANPGYRRLISNALHWLVSTDAAAWAQRQETPA